MHLHRLLYCFVASAAFAAEPANLVAEGDFANWPDGKPAGWAPHSPQEYVASAGPEGTKSLKVNTIKSQPGKSGEITQKLKVKPNQDYMLSGQIRTDSPGGGMLQVKRFQDGKEVERVNSQKVVKAEWTPASLKFNSGGADQIEVLLRWSQEEKDVGKSVEFAKLSLVERDALTYTGPELQPTAEATYNCLGLYWKPQGGSAKRAVTVQYRKEGEADWKDAMPLWFDATEHDKVLEHTAEYRGSIVSLTPNTSYEVKLKLQDGPERIIKTKTRSDEFKIARTVKVPHPANGTFTITEGGSAESGYVLYEPEDASKPWDAADASPSNLKVDASFVIIKGFNLKGGHTHGIVLGDVKDVVVDGCDVTGWGETGTDGQAKDLNGAIYARSPQLERITIQNCRLHHPRSDSNSWNEQRPGTDSSHPQGPQGIVLIGGNGGHVIRLNRIYSDIDHMFNDGMGNTNNFSYAGFPIRDSDIHDNFVSHCWDDGLEIEGADMNVRVWGNYIDMTYGAIGAASPSLGPLYIFRNVYAVSRKHSGTKPNDLNGHYLVKLGNEKPEWTKGRMYIFHNVTLQPPPFADATSESTSGAGSGIVFTSEKKLQENIVSRNNLLQMRDPRDWAIRDTRLTASNDFDYDMVDGKTMFRAGSEKNGITASPTFQRTPDGRLSLVPGTPGHDAGERLPNFNDGFADKGPDIGAVETGGKDTKPSTWPVFPEPKATKPAAPKAE